jgi:DNA transposition AAA+ family ATPase
MTDDTLHETDPAHTPDIREAVRAALKADGLTQQQAARRIGFTPPVLSQWLSGTYKGDVPKMDEQARRWLDSREAAAAIPAARQIGFVRTETAERLWAMFEQAQGVPSIVVCAGAPGIGKTTTARAYAASRPNVWMVTLDPMTVSPSQLLTEIAEVMGVPVGATNSLRNRIGARLEGSGGLIILDEANHVTNTKSLDMIRSLFDRYGIGIALVGNYGLFAATTAPNKTHGMAQFFRRVTKRAKFEQPSARDIAVILDAIGIEGAEERKFLSLIATKPWGLGGVQNTLYEAGTLALGEGVPMAIRHLRTAWSGLNHFDAV